MKTPKTVRIGRLRYKIVKQRLMRTAGYIHYKDHTLSLVMHGAGGVAPYTKQDIKHTFWHEVVHGILYDMRQHKLNNSERFVDGVAIRIVDVLRQLPKESR